MSGRSPVQWQHPSRYGRQAHSRTPPRAQRPRQVERPIVEQRIDLRHRREQPARVLERDLAENLRASTPRARPRSAQRWRPRAGATAFLGLGHTERFPDYWELFNKERADSVSAFGVAPEKTTQLDAGLAYRRGPLSRQRFP